ncbi:MAG: FAD-binding oxidoreductase, partial [Psychromonas sp.]
AIALDTLITDAQPPMFYQMLGTAMADFYGHQTTHGSFVFGGGKPLNPDLISSTADHTPIEATADTCRGILGYIPAMKHAKVVRSWVGIVDWCEDKVPVLSKVEDVPGLILGCGFSGHGFGIAPSVGTVLAELASDETPSIDICVFSSCRSLILTDADPSFSLMPITFSYHFAVRLSCKSLSKIRQSVYPYFTH